MRPVWLSSIIVILISIGAVGSACAQLSDAGKEDYLKLCASCHGQTGKGDGANAKSLRKPPTDLTKLSQNNNGAFPLARVYDAIDGRLEIIVHGPRDMPPFTEVLKKDIISRMPRDNMDAEFAAAMARQRLLQVIEYIMSLQNK
jgi:mono/diheme cytochrome c family protein